MISATHGLGLVSQLCFKQKAHDRKQKSSLVQVSALKELSLIPADAKKAIDLFLQEPDEGLAVSAPEANAYEFTGGISQILPQI